MSNNQIMIDIQDSDFESVERYNDGKDVSITLRNGDTLNVFIKNGITYIRLQSVNDDTVLSQ